MEDMDKTCKARVRASYNGRMQDLRKLWDLYRTDPDARTEDGENWNEYGLCWDYCPPFTWTDQKRGFFRYQLSTGGPGDEFRFYADERLQVTRVEYWFLDWGDGAKVNVTGRNLELLKEIWEDLQECGMPQEWMKKAE